MIVMLILTAATAAKAEQASPAAEAAHLELSLRAGTHSTAMELSDDAPEGSGPTLDVGAAWRFTPWLSVGGFVALSKFHDTTMDAFDPKQVSDHPFRALDIGARFSLHAGPVFAGLGLGVEKRHSGYTWDEDAVWSFGELHIGFRFPRISWLHGSIEVLALIGRSTTEYEHVDTRRLAVGVTF